jgi:glycoprotein endo-alpha-1,2-mannosidase
MASVGWARVGRWCCLRVRRTFLLLSFLSVVFLIVITVFLAVNQDHAQLNGLKARLKGGRGLGPDIKDMQQVAKKIGLSRTGISKGQNDIKSEAHKQRPMVQFFPDNQHKLLYRKTDFFDDIGKVTIEPQIIYDVPLSKIDGDAFEESIKSKIVNTVEATSTTGDTVNVTYDAHIFYYAWYGNPTHDNQWFHWNHEYLENWNKNDHRQMPTGRHIPENDDIGANFFPQLGAYSSRDPQIIAEHMSMLRQAKVGVLALSWYPPNLSDPNGPKVDNIVPLLLDAAQIEGLKVTLHIEPYQGRTTDNIRSNLKYIHEQYGSHPVFYKRNGKPFFYIYDSYLISTREWKRLLSSSGDLTIRGTELDATFLGILVDYKHRSDIKNAGFDGFYTYFASNGFSHGSTWKNWRSLAMFARKFSLLFVPSLGPGYIDTRVRPWNGQSTRQRHKGSSYSLAWRTFLGLDLPVVSITSFNEWHEGTQLEPAIPKSIEGYTYNSYFPDSPDCYLKQTSNWIGKFQAAKPKSNPSNVE